MARLRARLANARTEAQLAIAGSRRVGAWQRSRVAAALCAVALVASACNVLPLDANAPVADMCAPSTAPVSAPQAGAPTAQNIALSLDRFPLCDYKITLDAPFATTGWSRTFQPTDPTRANFVLISVQTLLLGNGESASAYVARRTTDTFHWTTSTPVMTEIAAEVVGDAAKAYRADAGPNTHPQYFYVTGYDGYAVVLMAEPSRSGIDATLALSHLVTVARGQLAFADQIFAAAGHSPAPTAALRTASPTAPPTTPPTARPTATSQVGCNSVYDGTYIGQASYEYTYTIYGTNTPVRSGPRAVSFQFVLRCSRMTADTVYLVVTQASASDSYFGALGLVPALGAAVLPRDPPTSTAAGAATPYAVAFTFPNGTGVNFYWVIVPSFAGDRITSELAADGRVPRPWLAAGPTALFPATPSNSTGPDTTYHGWSFTKSAR